MKVSRRQLHELGLSTIARWAKLVAKPTPRPATAQAQPEQRSSAPAPAPAPAAAPTGGMAAKASWNELQDMVATCEKCALCKSRTKAVFGRGHLAAGGLLIVGESPDAAEDKQGLPFVGDAGKLLQNMLHAIGLHDDAGVFHTNVVKCRPPADREFSTVEASTCDAYLARQVEILRPRLIVALGKACGTLLHTDEQLSDLRKRTHEYRGRMLLANYHPSSLLGSAGDKRQAWAGWLKARLQLGAGKD